MITTVEFDDLVAADESARETNGGHRSFSAAVDHADLLDRRHPVTDQLGELDLEWIGNSKTQTARRGVANCIDHDLWSVTKNRRTPTADVVDILFSINVPDFRTARTLNEKRFAANIA